MIGSCHENEFSDPTAMAEWGITGLEKETKRKHIIKIIMVKGR